MGDSPSLLLLAVICCVSRFSILSLVPIGTVDFDHNYTISIQGLGNLVDHCIYIFQVRRAILFFWGSNTYKNSLGILIGTGIIRSIGKPFFIFLHQRFQIWFVDRGYSLLHQLDFMFVNIYTGYMMACVGQGNSCHKTYIACTCNCYFHIICLPHFAVALSWIFILAGR